MEMMDFSDTGNLNESLSESIVPPILQGSFGIFGNLLALILLFCYSKSHKWGAFYKYVFALAITDLCGLLFHYPVAVTRYASNFEFDFPEKFCYFDVFLFSFSFLSSAMIVCAMSCDRLFAVRYPITYRRGNHKTKRVLLAVWIFSAIIASFPLLGFGSAKMYYPGTWCFINFASQRCLDRINTYVYSSLCLLILLITVIANTAVIYSICKYDKQDCIISNDFERRRRKNDETYIVTLMLSIVIVFSVCWIPLVVGT
ncbi:prostaglandin E2 receptor EP4 subtype-like [Saccostrea cucullata]|uniref:prostaglandin E2 receptor EP4 subtype-like n=1 Tax=Saccostrea cuccullata TaxID=36930 RepID=UPI002ED2B69A